MTTKYQRTVAAQAAAVANRNPYDTGKRSEPKVWTKSHIEDDDDYGKVDFENDEGGTLATLYIEQDDDRRGYTLKGWANEPLKVDIEQEEDPQEGVEPVETVHWFPGDLVERRMEVDGKYGPVMEPVFGLVRHILGEYGKWTLYVELPGRVGTPAWPASECRLLRRIDWNKEGQ